MILDKKHFYDSLMSYFINDNYEAMVYYDSFTQERYAAFGDGLSGIPRMFLDKESSVGNIDVYGIEFFTPVNIPEIIMSIRNYALAINKFLTSYHEKSGRGYILYRRTKKYDVNYLENLTSDTFYNEIKSAHYLIDKGNPVYKFINTSAMQWCVYSSQVVEETFSKIRLLFSEIQSLDSGNGLQINNYHIVASDLLNNGINFKWNGIQYTCSFPENQPIVAQFSISKKSNYIPLEIYNFYKVNLEDIIEELNTMNRLIALFDNQ